MIARETVVRLVERLPESLLEAAYQDLQALLEENATGEGAFEALLPLAPHVQAALDRALAGQTRFYTDEEITAKYGEIPADTPDE